MRWLDAAAADRETPPPKTHNLLRLVELLRGHVDLPDDLDEAAASLTPHAVLARYPTRFAPLEEDGRLALVAARRFRVGMVGP